MSKFLQEFLACSNLLRILLLQQNSFVEGLDFSVSRFPDVITPDSGSAFISYVFKKSVELELI